MAIIKTPGEVKPLQSGWVAGRASHPGLTPAEDGCTGLHGSVGRTIGRKRESAHAREAGLRRFASHVHPKL